MAYRYLTNWERTVTLLLGSMLVIVAALKVYGLNSLAVPAIGQLSRPWVQIVAIEWELILGFWLLSGVYPFWAWAAATGTFLTLATVSAYLGWAGVGSCGCFGAIHASPWWATGVDVIALALLLSARPRVSGSLACDRSSQLEPGWVAGCLAGFAVVCGLGVWFAGSPEAALAYLRGEPIAATTVLDLGTGHSGEKLTGEATVRNISDRPVGLIGGTADCTCVATAGLPVVIPPGESRAVPITLNVPGGRAGPLTRVVELHTDQSSQRVVRIAVQYRMAD